MTPVLLETRGLVKRFGGITATNDVSLSIARHSIHALIGPNGAGKTTCFNLLTTSNGAWCAPARSTSSSRH